MDPLPTAADINVNDTLDERSACELFLGVTLEQAEGLFREQTFSAQEALMWMGPNAFAYYLPTALGYLQSEASKGDNLVVSALLAGFNWRVEHGLLGGGAATVREVAEYVLANYSKFEVREVWGDLDRGYRELLGQLEQI